MWRKGNSGTLLMGMLIGTVNVEIGVLQKNSKYSIELLYDPAIQILGIYLKHAKALIQKDTCSPKFNSSIVYNTQDMKAIQVPVNRLIFKEDMVRIHNGILLSHKNVEHHGWTWRVCLVK